MQEDSKNEAQEPEAIVFPEDDFTTTAPQTEEATDNASAEATEAPEATPQDEAVAATEDVPPTETPCAEETPNPADEATPETTDNADQPDNADQADSTDEAQEETDAAAEEAEHKTFADFGFSEEVMQGINEAGFKEPTPIQAKAMPMVAAGKDLIGQALTGSGKTAAFGLPIINKIAHEPGLNFLVLVPTRELATQVSGELFRLGRYTGLKTAAFTGGQSYSRQEQLLRQGVNALVATPGRLIDLIDSGHFEDINPAHIVVDEADEMLDMGFIEDVRRIFRSFPGPRQTMLFSATMPRPVVQLAEEILNDPQEITTSEDESTNNEAIEQLFFVIEESERANAVIRLIDANDVGKAMIFCRTKEETDSLNILLSGRGYNVNCLHGDMEQAQRSRVMNAFRRGEIDILVATDVAARGLDVDDVTHVFNYHLPFDSRGYVHRIGRTGRAGKTGTAITLVTPREMRALDMIKKHAGAKMENRLVPTRTEVTELRLKKIFRELNEVQLDVNLLNQVQTLVTNQDLTVLIAKLVAHELTMGGDTGPEHIGVNPQRLARLLTPRPFDRKRGEPRGERGDRPRRDRGDRGDRFGRSRRGDRRRNYEDNNDFNREESRPQPPERNEQHGSHEPGEGYFSTFNQIEQTAPQNNEFREHKHHDHKEFREDREDRFERRERPERSFSRRNREDFSRPPYEENAPTWKHYRDEEENDAPRSREEKFSKVRDVDPRKHKTPYERKSYGDRKAFGDRDFRGGKKFGDHKPYGDRKSFGDRKTFGDRDSKPFADKGGKKSFENHDVKGSKKSFDDHKKKGDKGRKNKGGSDNWYFN